MPLLYVIVFLALGKKEDEGEDKREKLRNRDCPPYTVHTEEYRKYKNRRGLKNQRSHERYCCGETAPLLRAVKNDEVKILKPASRNE